VRARCGQICVRRITLYKIGSLFSAEWACSCRRHVARHARRKMQKINDGLYALLLRRRGKNRSGAWYRAVGDGRLLSCTMDRDVAPYWYPALQPRRYLLQTYSRRRADTSVFCLLFTVAGACILASQRRCLQPTTANTFTGHSHICTCFFVSRHFRHCCSCRSRWFANFPRRRAQHHPTRDTTLCCTR